MFALYVFLAVLALASAFGPARMGTRASMTMKLDMPKLAAPAVLAPFMAPMTAMAAEGTSRAFGIDDSRLILAALLPSFIIFPLYLNWASQQDGDDFFDGYEKRRQG